MTPMVAKVTGREGGNLVLVDGDDFSLSFNRVWGVISDWTASGCRLLKQGPKLNFWRATTDNDRGSGGVEPNDVVWRRAGLHWLQHRVDDVTWTQLDGRRVQIRVKVRIAPPIFSYAMVCDYVYTIDGNGGILIEVGGEPQGQWPATLPRIGLQMTIPSDLTQVSWFGRGPGESYVDTKQAARVGRYACSVDELYTPYVYPQENGNRSEVRWATFSDLRSRGFTVVGRPQLNFSAHRFTTQDLDQARHPYELPRRDEITLNLDLAQNGIGTASCGPGVLPQYWLKPEKFTFAVYLIPSRPI